MTNELFFEIVKVVVMIVALVLARYVIPWVKTQLDASQIKLIMEWVNVAVLCVQQTFKDYTNEEKKQAVVKYINKLLADKGIELTAEQIDILIEAAVKQMKIEESKGE